MVDEQTEEELRKDPSPLSCFEWLMPRTWKALKQQIEEEVESSLGEKLEKEFGEHCKEAKKRLIAHLRSLDPSSQQPSDQASKKFTIAQIIDFIDSNWAWIYYP